MIRLATALCLFVALLAQGAMGRDADLVLLDRDLTTIPVETIRETEVLKTIVGGRVVYSR